MSKSNKGKNDRTNDRRQARKVKEAAQNSQKPGDSVDQVMAVLTIGDQPLIPPMTVAGKAEYDAFFGLYAESVRQGKEAGFRPLGFIPGPAIILDSRGDGKVQISAATPDVAKGLKKLPSPWISWGQLPKEIRQALEEWQSVKLGIGYAPSPYNFGLARNLLAGKAPTKYLAMMMPHFRYRPGDPELPFGVILTPAADQKMRVKTYNPQGIPDVPPEGTIMTLAELKEGRGPIQKLLRTWALMEGNYLARFDRQGNPRQNQNDQKPVPQLVRRPTLAT